MPWTKGQSGNPNGRPKKSPFNDQLRLVVTDPKLEGLGNPENGKTPLRLAVEHLVLAATQGEQWAIRELADRLDGKPAQTIDQNVNDTRPKSEWTRSELVEIVGHATDGSTRVAGANGRNGSSDPIH